MRSEGGRTAHTLANGRFSHSTIQVAGYPVLRSRFGLLRETPRCAPFLSLVHVANTATVPPGTRSTSRRSCRIAGRFAEGNVRVFARPGPHAISGGPAPAKVRFERCRRARRERADFPHSLPRRGSFPHFLSVPSPLRAKGNGGWLGEDRTPARPVIALELCPNAPHDSPLEISFALLFNL